LLSLHLSFSQLLRGSCLNWSSPFASRVNDVPDKRAARKDCQHCAHTAERNAKIECDARDYKGDPY